MTTRRFIATVLLVVSAGFVLASCGGDDKSESTSSATTEAPSASQGTTASLTTKDFMFEPTTVSAKAGQAVTVTIKNQGGVEHNFTIESLKVDKDIEKGESATVTFMPAAAGNIEFFCKYHKGSGMVGTLQVT